MVSGHDLIDLVREARAIAGFWPWISTFFFALLSVVTALGPKAIDAFVVLRLKTPAAIRAWAEVVRAENGTKTSPDGRPEATPAPRRARLVPVSAAVASVLSLLFALVQGGHPL